MSTSKRIAPRLLSRLGVLAALTALILATVAVGVACATADFTNAPDPTIVGEAGVGQTLAAVTGSWSPAPDSFTYQWFADGTAIDGETGPTYVIGVDQTCLPISVQVTGIKEGYNSASRTSAQTALAEPVLGLPDFTSAPAPTITGTAAVGHTLTAVTGSWSPSADLFTYQWYADGGAIGGATGGTYGVSAGDLGKKISVQVIAFASGYNSTYRTSAQTDPVLLTAATLDFTTTSDPTITGTPAVGHTLTALTGSWGPAPDAFTYQWYADGGAISGATGSTYAPTSDVVGKKISVRVTGVKSGYNSVAKVSGQTAAVTGDFTSALTPTITGTPATGHTLTVVTGAWSPAPDSFSYQWYADGAAIGGATGSSYSVTNDVVGKKISAQVTGVKTSYNSAARTSAQTAVVTGGFTSAPIPTIKGTAAVGKTLKVQTGAWSPVPTFSYQWYASGKKIKGGTKSSIKLTAALKGKKITVSVTAAKANYVSLTETSAATAKVKK